MKNKELTIIKEYKLVKAYTSMDGTKEGFKLLPGDGNKLPSRNEIVVINNKLARVGTARVEEATAIIYMMVEYVATNNPKVSK